MRLTCALCILGLLLTACRHAPKPMSEDQIRQHIVGVWQPKNLPQTRSTEFASDGSVTHVKPDGTVEPVGTWRLKNDLLTIDTYKANYIVDQDGRQIPMGKSVDYIIQFVDEHKLVLNYLETVSGQKAITFTR